MLHTAVATASASAFHDIGDVEDATRGGCRSRLVRREGEARWVCAVAHPHKVQLPQREEGKEHHEGCADGVVEVEERERRCRRLRRVAPRAPARGTQQCERQRGGEARRLPLSVVLIVFFFVWCFRLSLAQRSR